MFVNLNKLARKRRCFFRQRDLQLASIQSAIAASVYRNLLNLGNWELGIGNWELGIGNSQPPSSD
ncbi:hypothetical protein QUA70_03360 [Microcoleus sp. LAD1_D5]|uniref:hypothetical protein n=1 Tax=unclassified Microcoleus TaxID=2642155 RepID=UPI002FD2B529